MNTYNNDYFETNNIISDDGNIDDTDDFFTEIFGTSDDINSNKHEIEDYLNKPVEHMKTEPLPWWKVILTAFATFFKYIIHF